MVPDPRDVGHDGGVALRDPLIALLEAAREGNDAALAELVRETQPVVWRLCAALGSPEDPADLTQETFVRVLRAMHTFRGEAPVQAWILSIARRVCADSVRKRQRQRRLIDRLSMALTSDEQLIDDGSLDDLIARLAPERREAFVLTQQLGLTYDEAAEIVGCPVGTIRSRLARARADLLNAVRSAETG
jgi:RNA polymerase sigma-70 factor (ECF subfamily)